MNKNLLIALVAVAVLAIVAFAIFGGRDAVAPQEVETENNNNNQNNGTESENEAEEEEGEEEEGEGEVHTISYTGSGFSPQNITIQLGHTVVFKNDSSGNMWPASNDHPIHNDYSEFDSRGPVAAGSSYSFTFEREGAWGYHDHLRPNFGGTITVQ